MQHLQIFENKELQQLDNASARIVEALSNNYTTIIDSMVGKSTTTKKTYKRNAEHFVAFIQSNGINSQSYGAYRNRLEKVEGISAKTKNAYLAASKALLREALKYQILPIDITANVPQFKISTGHVKDGLNEKEVKKIIKHIKGIKRESTRWKLHAMFQLFVAEGLRQMEVQQIRLEDINVQDAIIYIRAKGAEEKSAVTIFQHTAQLLEGYMEYLNKDQGFLFHSKSDIQKPITLRAIRKMWTCPIYGIFKKCDIEGRSVHGFRHFFTTKTLDLTKGDLHKTQLRTRHKATSTLRIYDDRRVTRKEMEKMEKAFIF